MGLRFRKSVTLCKGVKLNFGKTGMSVSVGGKGYHKTINTKGQVTTSVGIPGTGIYYTDTKRLGNNKQSGTNTRRNAVNQYYNQSTYIEPQQEYDINDSVEEYLTHSETSLEANYEQYESEPNESVQTDNEETINIEENNKILSANDIKNIYIKSDEPVDWTELLVSVSAEDVFMEQDKWHFLKNISRKVLSGDIDAYLETIEKMRPVDDLLEYGSSFEFGTDNPNCMEVEFQINSQNTLSDQDLFDEYLDACTIRVARDLFALLPVKYVIVYVKNGENSILEAKFDKNKMETIDFERNGAEEIIRQFII